MKDKREHQRIQLLRKVTVFLENGTELILDVLDYSMGGMSVLSKEALPQGASVRLESLTTLDGEEKRLGLVGEIIHTRQSEQGYIIGVMFENDK